jgi:competence protein ComEA
MKMRSLAAADATFAALLLLVLLLLTFREPVIVEEGSGFVIRTAGNVTPDSQPSVSPAATILRVNPNRADKARLATLPGVGAALARTIIQFRKTHGPFLRLADLQGVPGIGPKRLQKMLPYLTLEEEATWSTK